MFKTINESVLELSRVISESGDDPLHIIEDSGVRYTRYLRFATEALANRVKEAAAKRDGVNLDVQGRDMFFPDEFTFNHIWYHYKVKIQPGKVSIETLDLPIGESIDNADGLGYTVGRHTTTHTVQAFRHVCDHYRFTIERNPSGVGNRCYVAKNAQGEVVGNFMDGLGTFQNEKLVDPVDAHVQAVAEGPTDMVQADIVNGRPVNQNSESLDAFDIWYYDAKGNDELPSDASGMEEFCRRLWNAAVASGSPSLAEGMVLDVQQKMVKVEPSMSQLKYGAEALRRVMSMGGFSSTELRKYCAAVYSAMVGGVQVNQPATKDVIESDIVDEAPSKPVTDVDMFLKMLTMLCGSKITLKDFGPNSQLTYYMRSPAKLILKSSDSWLPLMAITPDRLVDAGLSWAITDVVAFLQGKGIRQVKRPTAKRPTTFSMYDSADMSDAALSEGDDSAIIDYDDNIAARIDNFLSTYAKLSANYDPEYDDADERWNGPDSAMLDMASKAIKAGQTPQRVHSDIGSGCYKDYNDPIVQQEHDTIVAAVNDLARGQVTEAGPGSRYSRGNGWVILPATMSLYGKRVVDITTAASEWAPHEETILVCQLENGRIAFLASSGGGEGFKVGETRECFHDQTQASKGMYKVLNIVVFRDGEIASKANEVGLNVKASVAVFK